MTKQELLLAKKRGRPVTGRGQTIGVRLQPDQLAALDVWRAGQAAPMSRPEAIRKILAEALQLKASGLGARS